MNEYHSRDLRKGRFSEPDRPYLITTATFQRNSLFSDPHVAKLLADEIHHAVRDGFVESLCWVIMPDHLHWLLVLRRRRLDRVIRQVKSRSAIAINRERGKVGKVWQPGFHDRALRQDEDIKQVARYLVSDPLRAGLVERIEDYPLWDAVWVDRNRGIRSTDFD